MGWLSIYFTGCVFGLVVFIFHAIIIQDDRYAKYWSLFTFGWPLGLIVFILWICKTAYYAFLDVLTGNDTRI